MITNGHTPAPMPRPEPIALNMDQSIVITLLPTGIVNVHVPQNEITARFLYDKARGIIDDYFKRAAEQRRISLIG